MAGRFTIAAVFTAVDNWARPLARMQSRLQAFGTRAQLALRGIDRWNSQIIAGFQRVGTTLAALSVPVGLVGAKVIAAGMDFEAAMSGVSAVSNATGEQFDALKTKAMELGASTKYTGTEVAGAMEIMAKAGLNVEQVLAGVPGILSAAAADGATIEETATSLMGAMKSLGMGPEKMQLFADQLAKAGDSTAASIGTLAQSIGIFGPVVKQLGIPVESAIAQIALLQDAGIDASSAGTTLAATYSKLAAPMGRTKEAIKKLGIEVKDSMGNMKPPDQLLNEILAATGKVKGNVGQMAAFTELVGLESQKALLNVAGAAKDGRLAALTENLNDAAGYADKLASKRMDNLKGDLTLLSSAVDGVAVSLFDMEGGPLRDTVKSMTAWLDQNKQLITSGVSEFIADIKNNLPAIAKWSKRIAIGIGAFYAWTFAVKVASAATTAWSTATAVATFVKKILTATIVKNTAATVWNTTITKGHRLAIMARTGAMWLANTATTALTGSTTTMAGATTAAAGATRGATVAMRGFAGAAAAATAAIGALYLAYDQFQSFAKDNDGLGFFDALMKSDGSLEGMFAVVDSHMNKKAIARAKQRKKDAAKEDATDPFGAISKFEEQFAQIDPRTGAAQAQVLGEADKVAHSIKEEIHREEVDITIHAPDGQKLEVKRGGGKRGSGVRVPRTGGP